MREYVSKVALELQDVHSGDFDHLHEPDFYDAPQAFAKTLRESGSNGILYRSVRNPGGECVALLRPKASTIPVHGGHYRSASCF